MVWAPEVPPVPWQSMAQSVVLFIPSLSQVSPQFTVLLGQYGQDTSLPLARPCSSLTSWKEEEEGESLEVGAHLDLPSI